MFGCPMTDYDKKIYETEINEFVPKHMVDSHTHVYEFGLKKGVKQAPSPSTSWTGKVAKENHIEDIVQTYKDAFPNQKVVPVIFGSPSADKVATNGYISKVAKEYNYPALYCTHVNMTADFLEEEVIKGGFQGLKPYCGNVKDDVFPPEAGIFDFLPHEHLKVANKYGWKVVLHISKSDRLKNADNIRDLMEIEQKYPNVKLIVAHIGRAYAPEDIGDAFETLKHTKNMMFDFCANTLPEATEKCIEAVGTKRLLWGTDLPIAKMRMYRIHENGNYVNVVPRGVYGDVSSDIHMRETDDPNITTFTYETIRGFMKTVKKMGLTKQDVEDVMCNNAVKLYDIKF